MTKIVIIGNGWRANYFHRIAKELPDEFQISAVITRSQEKASEVTAQWGVPATTDWEEGLHFPHDYVILCVNRAVTADFLQRLFELGEAVLCETPPGYSAEDFQKIWDAAQEHQARAQICEQYQFWPLYSSCLEVIRRGLTGEISNVSLSAVHGYHAVSLFRKFLGVGFEDCRISGKRYEFDVTYTMGRDGYDESGRVIRAARDMVSLDFANGKSAFLDFSDEQYFSPIRTRRMNIQGVRGEINDLTVRYLNAENRPVTLPFARLDDGFNNIQGWSHQGIMLGSDFLYRTPFPGAKLNDDEIAVATAMRRMKEYADGGREFYSLADGLQDAYLACRMDEAVQNPGTVVEAVRQPWAESF
ncbi:MAG: Gfo/Idh/MocA family oxidoreductase [Clostridiales bacterium]|nr:Gfo/Idh/MocA family oxidoreductase [Clostridiales bacterium]